MAFSSNRPLADPLSDNQPAAPPDLSLINELYEAIEKSPPSLEARKLLVQHLMACGWLDAARDTVSELLLINPKDNDAQGWLAMLPPAKTGDDVPAPANPRQKRSAPIIENKEQLRKGYKSLFRSAKMLHWEMNSLRDLLQKKLGSTSSAGFFSTFGKNSSVAGALAEGRLYSAREGQSKPGNARQVARLMERNPTRALDIGIQDLTDMAHWLRSAATNQPQPQSASASPEAAAVATEPDNDAVREALLKRTQALISTLPKDLKQVASTALMHVEHEILHRKYICSETMYGDTVSEIPRARFWVSEDGYPWDMEELAQALTSNGGVMRNPLSRQLFTPSDVKAIVAHPLGKPLAALQVAQSELSKGVRPKTIEQMAHMSAILLNDNSSDQMTSRHVIDEFLAYVATLPKAEQKALERLRVPAKDSHTGQPFDSTIGEAVRDAQGNRVCIHKIGDFLGQAAKHLRKNG